MSGLERCVAGYARVSTENQTDNYSIEEQCTRLRAYCEARGWGLFELYVDAGFSGGNTDRPALQKLLQDVRYGRVDAVLVCKLDRLSRSQKDTLMLIEDELLRHGADFVSISENFDTSTALGRAMIGILSVFAQLEKEQITERFTMGRIGRSRAGYFHGGGHPPTGYNYVDGLLTVNGFEAVQVQSAFRLFLSGASLGAAAHAIRERYGGNWTAAKVRSVLRNNVYIGKVKFRGESYDGLHPPLVSAEDFRRANDLLDHLQEAASERSSTRCGYLLSGLLHCARCGARYHAGHGCYRCYSRDKCSEAYIRDPDCRNRNWPIPVLDEAVTEQVLLVLEHCRLPPSETATGERETVQRALAQLSRQAQQLTKLCTLEALSVEEACRQLQENRRQQEVLLSSLSRAESAAGQLRLPLRERFAAMDMPARRTLIRALIGAIHIDGDTLTVHWRF